MEIIKRNLNLLFLCKNKKLNLIKSEYTNNSKAYFGLLCKNWEPFSDITVNDPSIYTEPNENLIDRDFINFCFGGDVDKCEERLQKNLGVTALSYRTAYYSFIL